MKGSPAKLGTIQGTASHNSALKMMAHMAPSPSKSHVSGHGTYKGALESNPELENLIATRNKVKDAGGDYKSNPEYAKAQNAINRAYYGPDFKDKYDEGTVVDDKKQGKLEKIEGKKEKATIKEGTRIGEAQENYTVKEAKAYTKAERKTATAKVKHTRRQGTLSVKEARQKYGRGSDEVKQAKLDRKSDVSKAKKDRKITKTSGKLTRLEAKRSDMEGEKGGKEAKGVIGNIRKGINVKRTKKATEKLDELNSPATYKSKENNTPAKDWVWGGDKYHGAGVHADEPHKKEDKKLDKDWDPDKTHVPDKEGKKDKRWEDLVTKKKAKRKTKREWNKKDKKAEGK